MILYVLSVNMGMRDALVSLENKYPRGLAVLYLQSYA